MSKEGAGAGAKGTALCYLECINGVCYYEVMIDRMSGFSYQVFVDKFEGFKGWKRYEDGTEYGR